MRREITHRKTFVLAHANSTIVARAPSSSAAPDLGLVTKITTALGTDRFLLAFAIRIKLEARHG